jgi:hypothetical protein
MINIGIIWGEKDWNKGRKCMGNSLLFKNSEIQSKREWFTWKDEIKVLKIEIIKVLNWNELEDGFEACLIMVWGNFPRDSLDGKRN